MKVTVIGTGLTGLLTAARLAKAGHEVIVIGESHGGLIQNYHQDGFSFDFGGHVYGASNFMVKALLEGLPSTTFHPERKAFYLEHLSIPGRDLIPYPVQSHAEKLGIKITSTGDGDYHEQSLKDYAVETLGHDFYYKWFRPFNSRVWSTPPEDMDCDWTAGRVQLSSEQRGGWGANAAFYYARGEDITKELLSQLSRLHVDVITGRAVLSSRSLMDHSVGIRLGTDGRVNLVNSDWIVSTMPLNVLLQSVGMPTLERVQSNTVITVGLGLNKRLDADFHWMYNDVTGTVHRTTLLSRYAKGNAPAGTDSLLVEIPFRSIYSMPNWVKSLQHELTGAPYPQGRVSLTSFTWDLIRDIGFEDVLHPEDVETAAAAMFAGYPIPMQGVRRDVATVKRWLTGAKIISAGRWGSHGYFNFEHCISEADAVLRQITIGSEGHDKGYLTSNFYYNVYKTRAL